MKSIKFPEYSGISYEQASLEIERLLKRALTYGQRFAIIERLAELRTLAMQNSR